MEGWVADLPASPQNVSKGENVRFDAMMALGSISLPSLGAGSFPWADDVIAVLRTTVLKPCLVKVSDVLL